jgi:two-component system sensor histidine kinase ChiS
VHIGPIIRQKEGFIDKYMGDGVMALFPKLPDDAIQAAIEMCKELACYNQNRANLGLVEIKSGIGIHMGTLMLGTIGEEKRMQGTVISDSVNLASRLESLTKDFGVSILISKEIFSRLEDPDRYKYRFLGNTNVKGKSESVAIFEIYDADPVDVMARKDLTKREFENAVYYFGIEDYSEAAAQFQNVLTHYPGDKASSLYLEKCREKRLEIKSN